MTSWWKWELIGLAFGADGFTYSTSKWFSKKSEAKKYAEENCIGEYEIRREAWTAEKEEFYGKNVIS